jgi:hypothetical protein
MPAGCPPGSDLARLRQESAVHVLNRDRPALRPEIVTMRRVYLIPLLGLGAIMLLSSQIGFKIVPATILGLPTPLVLFAGLSVFILAMLRTS